MNFCNKDCVHLNKQLDICKKYESILARNIYGDLFKCYKCKECLTNESKNKT